MIRVSARMPELHAKSRSCRPEVRVTAGETPESEPNCPETELEWGSGSSTEIATLKTLLNPPKI